MNDQCSDQKTIKKAFSGYFFLLGCAALPFFNDFPLFSKIAPTLRDLPTVFFLLSGLFLVFELFSNVLYRNVGRTDFIFVIGFTTFIWISVILNYFPSSQVCGNEICGNERLLNSAISFTMKLFFLLLSIKIVKNEGIKRIAKFVRFGFYLSFLYVMAELIFLVIPYYFGHASFGAYDLLESYFHIRENDYGGSRTRGLSFEPSYQAVYLIICLPFLLADINVRRRIRNVLGWTICLLSSLSTTGIVAAIFFTIFFKYHGRKLFFIIVSLTFFSFLTYNAVLSLDLLQFFDLYGTNFTSSVIRSGSWMAGFDAVLDKPLFGVGSGMSGYWLIDYYPDFFLLSDYSNMWYEIGKSNFDAPTFSSLITFFLEYGLILPAIILIFFIHENILQEAVRSKIGRASLISILIVSFGITSFQIWGYFLFLAITLSKQWNEFDMLSKKYLSLRGNI